MDMEVLNGNVILINESSSPVRRPQDFQKLNGLPVILGQKIEIPATTARLNIEYYNGASLRMDGPSLYESHELGAKSDEYDVSLRQDNGWYYARLESVSPSPRTSTRITLLSPQMEADKEAPLIEVAGGFRAPVYLDRAIDLREQITDVSGISDVFIDTDLAADSDRDGQMDNDRDSDAAGSIFRKGSSNLEWIVKAQDRLFEKKIKIWAGDESGNLAGTETDLRIYAPVPNISTQSGTTIFGNLDESLDGEPTDIVRYRNGKISPIGNAALTQSGGEFLNTFGTNTGIAIR
jgi:hypothetical protein